MDTEEMKDCDICLGSLPNHSILTWDCKQCNWCYECITNGITSAPQKSDWPQNWCSHDPPTWISLKTIISKARKHMPPHVYTKWFEKQEQWSQIKCPHCCRFTHSDHIEERVLHCPKCHRSICTECEKPAHEGQCNRTSKEDLKAVMNALRHEDAAMCPRCSHIAGRMKEGCDRIVCTEPCTQVFCFKCSRDWALCKGKCKGGSTPLLAEKAEAEDPSIATAVLNGRKDTIQKEMQLVDSKKLTKERLEKIKEDYAFCISTIDHALLDGSASSYVVMSDIQRLADNFIITLHEARGILVLPRETSDDKAPTHEDEEIEEEPAYSDEDEEVEAQLNRKRAPTGDPLSRRLLKKPKIETIDDEEDANDLEADSDSGEDEVAHDDEDDEGGFDINEEDGYRSDNDEGEEQDDEFGEDHVEW